MHKWIQNRSKLNDEMMAVSKEKYETKAKKVADIEEWYNTYERLPDSEKYQLPEFMRGEEESVKAKGEEDSAEKSIHF